MTGGEDFGNAAEAHPLDRLMGEMIDEQVEAAARVYGKPQSEDDQDTNNQKEEPTT